MPDPQGMPLPPPPPPAATGSDGLGAEYMAYRDQASGRAAGDELLSRVAARQAAGAQPAAPGQAEPQPAAAPPAEAPEKPEGQAGEPSPLHAHYEPQIAQEVERLKQPPFDASRYANPDEALRARAVQNLGLPPEPVKPADQVIDQERARIAAEGGPKVEAAAIDVGKGLTVQLPRAIYTGVHGAVQAMFDGAHSINQWMDEKTNWPDIYIDLAKGHPLFSVKHADEFGAFEVPGQVAPPSTVTGTIVKNGVQFATGVAIGGREMQALGLPTKLAGWAGRGVSAAKGFLGQFQAFDGASGRLSDLIQSVPALRNPVTEFLATKPDDSEAVGRLKNAVEGTALAQVADGIVAGIRALRSANAARAGAQEIVAADAARPPPPVSAGLTALGDAKAEPKAPLVEVVSKQDAQAAKLEAARFETEGMAPEKVAGMAEPAAEGEVVGPASPGATEAKAKEPGVYVNFAKIDGPDDLKRAMSELATEFQDNIAVARRGVQTFEQTKLGANAVDAWQTLMDRRVGEPLNDAQSLAARQLWASSAAKTMELANIAVESPTPENLFAFRKMIATHAAIQEQVLAARTEAARSLGSWRIPAGPDDLRLEAMSHALADVRGMRGGLDTALEFATRVRALGNAGDLQSLEGFAAKGSYASTRDAILETWTNGLLTAAMTHVKVAVSNAVTVAQRIVERATAARINQLLGDTDGVQLGEASAQYAGLIGGIKDSMRFIGKAANSMLAGEKPALGTDPISGSVQAARSGHYSQELSPYSEYMQNNGAVSSEALGIASDTWLGRGIDLAGQIIRVPGRALTAEHDYFRSLGYRMEVHAQAVRQAVADVQAGNITQDGLGERVAALVADPPPSIKLAAVNGMTYQTFTDAPGVLAEKIGGLRNAIPEFRVILPFYRIPSRILSYTFERSPLAPLMSTFRANVAAGGPRQSLALAQMSLGSMVMMAAADAVLSGTLTGSGPTEHGTRAAMENEGWQPYSIKIGDRWVQYNRIETTGSSMAMAADAVEAIRNFQTGVNADDPDVTNLAFATGLAVAQDVTSKSYLTGLSNFFEAMASPKSEGKRLEFSLAGSLVPAGLASIDRVTDPYKRTVYSMISAIQARTPGQSENLPPVRNLWGEPVPNASGMGKAYDLLVPAATKTPANEPIDKELLRMGVNLSRVPAKPSADGVPVDLTHDPKAYSRYQELAGNEYKHPAMGDLGLKDALNALVTGESPFSPVYEHMPDGSGAGEEKGTKGTMIRDFVNTYRRGALAQLLDENKGLSSQVDAKRQAMQDRAMTAASQ